MKKPVFVLTFLSVVVLAGLVHASAKLVATESGQTKKALHDKEHYPVAWARIDATAEGSSVSGKAKFYETEEGLKAVIKVSGVTPPGKHGIHVHENGSCDDGGKAAGGHFNPHGAPHGFLPENGFDHAHVGDMGNIEIDENGDGLLKIHLPGLSLQGDHGIIGRSVILHENEDDFGQPLGNAGGRIGCGIIEAKDKKMKEEDPHLGHSH